MALPKESKFERLRRVFASRLVTSIPLDEENSQAFYAVTSAMRRASEGLGTHRIYCASLTGAPVHFIVHARLSGGEHKQAQAAETVSDDGKDWIAENDTKPGSVRASRVGPAHYAVKRSDSLPTADVTVIIAPMSPIDRTYQATKTIALA